MVSLAYYLATLAASINLAIGAGFPTTCPAPNNATKVAGRPNGACPGDFDVIGPVLEAVHESKIPPTGLAVDPDHNIYLAYPRNSGPQPVNVVKATSFDTEEPWPNAPMQNCTKNQDPKTCFVNVQNIILDSNNTLWIVDSGIPPGMKSAVSGGSKIMSFDLKGNLKRTYAIPDEFLHDNMNANDIRINNTLGKAGYAFITDESDLGSILSINLDDGKTNRRLFNTSCVKADDKYVGVYNGQPIYQWNGTQKSYFTTGSDGIALASGNVYWGILASRRYYYVPQEVIINNDISDADVLKAVQNPGQCASEQAGFTADENGRVYIMAGEHNAIFYVDTQYKNTKDTVNGNKNTSGAIPATDYVMKTSVRSALIQHADSAAILDGYLYFCTNQLPLSPGRQYMNKDGRKGPFRSYRYFIGAGPAA